MSHESFIAKGLSSGNANQPVSGGFKVDELYAEAVYQVHSMLSFTAATRMSAFKHSFCKFLVLE